jgi:hypothetical protein
VKAGLLRCWQFAPFLFLLLALGGLAKPAAAQDYVEGVSEITDSTTSTELYTYSDTFLTYDLSLYYSPYLQAYLYQNSTEVAAASTGPDADAQDAALDGSWPVTLGDTYEIDGDHSVVAIYEEDDDGTVYYENPDGFLEGGTDPGDDGTDYGPGDGPVLIEVEQIYLGSTAAYITAAAPSISGISPTSGTIGTSGTITVNGENLLDVFTDTTTPAISGSGVTLTVGSSPTDTQVNLNYTIASNATTGNQSVTLATRFGTSNAVSFMVGDPPARITNISPPVWTAGQNNLSVTITGQNFGTSPTLSLSGSRVYLIGYTPNPNGQSIQATVNVAVNAPNESVTVTVQPGYAGNSFTCNCQGASPNGTGTATTQAVTPTPQIMFNGQNISGQTNIPVLAGQQITLSVSAPSGYSLLSPSWTFSNTQHLVGGYTNSSLGGSSPPDAGGGWVQPANLSGNSVTNYFIVPGATETVTYAYQLDNGESATATASFSVGGPLATGVNGTYFTATSGIVNVYPPGVAFHGLGTWPGLEFGDAQQNADGTLNVGMAFSIEAKAPSNAGAFQWVQLINHHNNQRLTKPASSPYSASIGVDNFYPYPFFTPPLGTNDSPGLQLSQTGLTAYGEAQDNFSATMYLMWDPSLNANGSAAPGCAASTDNATLKSTASTCTGSIPIPLSSVTWGFSGCAINTLTVNDATTTTWSLYCPTTAAPTPVVQPSSSYPQWSTTASNTQLN